MNPNSFVMEYHSTRGTQSMLNHNVISNNQLADWKETTEAVYEVDNHLNNYYECIIDAGDDKYTARRCSRLLQ